MSKKGLFVFLGCLLFGSVLIGFFCGIHPNDSVLNAALSTTTTSPTTATVDSTTTDSTLIYNVMNGWPNFSLPYLYARFDKEFAAGHYLTYEQNIITFGSFNRCISLLEAMMQRYESSTNPPASACVEARKEFWPRISKLENIRTNLRNDDIFQYPRARLYRRYGALWNKVAPDAGKPSDFRG